MCPAASNLVVLKSQVRGLLSVYTSKLVPYREAWNSSVTDHFRAKYSVLRAG